MGRYEKMRTDIMALEDEKLNRFIGFYDAQPSTQTAVYKVVDLRYENGIAIENLTNELAGVAAR